MYKSGMCATEFQFNGVQSQIREVLFWIKVFLVSVRVLEGMPETKFHEFASFRLMIVFRTLLME
jgi:hypothetical protein